MMADDRLSADEQIEIVCLMIDRNEEGLVRLLRAYSGRIAWDLLHKYEALNEQDMEEIIQTAAFKAWARAETFDYNVGTLGGWFYTIAKNTAIDVLRGKPDADDRPIELSFEPAVEGRVPAALEDEEFEPEAVTDLLEEIETLGEKQRVIIKADLAVGGEADAEFLADRLGIPKQRVYTYRNKAHEALKKRLKKRGHTAATFGSRK